MAHSVHVCHRWRHIVFGSPRRLDLRLLCTHGTPVRKNLGCLPAFPIVIHYCRGIPNDVDNIIAALEHPDRIHHLDLKLLGSQLRKVVAVMQVPFPALTHLSLESEDKNAPVLPDEFLGGSAPFIQEITLKGVIFPALPTLLSSSGYLLILELHEIPLDGYISPEVMVACLAALPILHSLIIRFQSPASRPDQIHLPPATRTVVPSLMCFEFKGASEYLEDLVARIDCPELAEVQITYSNQLVDLQAAQLFKFIDRPEDSEMFHFRHAEVIFTRCWVTFQMYESPELVGDEDWGPVRTTMLCQGIDWQVSHISQVLTQPIAILSHVAHLKLVVHFEAEEHCQLEGIEDAEWLDLLRQFSAVQSLHVSPELAGNIALALEDITEEIVAGVLPALDLLCLEDRPVSSVEKFLAVRRLSGRPVTLVDTEEEFDERVDTEEEFERVES